MSRREIVTVYFDYLCPYVWHGAEVAEQVAEVLNLTFLWRHFSLYQHNYDGDDGWQLWNDPVETACDSGGKGLLLFLASCAARRQGQEYYDRFRLELLRARYRDHRPYTYRTIFAVAASVGLNLEKFEHDLSDPECRTVLAHEHYRAKALDIFGTPTFQFASGHSAYLRLKEIPHTQEEAVELFQSCRVVQFRGDVVPDGPHGCIGGGIHGDRLDPQRVRRERQHSGELAPAEYAEGRHQRRSSSGGPSSTLRV